VGGRAGERQAVVLFAVPPVVVISPYVAVGPDDTIYNESAAGC
jgi:hypothetical protein